HVRALCPEEVSEHGAAGVVGGEGSVDNDATNARYVELAVAQAESGAHVVGPSGMMDGQVAVSCDGVAPAGHTDTVILAYAAKFASGFYGPFREAVGSSLRGDRRTYQQDAANAREAVHEIELDIDEGADIIMVKPAMSYLDVVRAAADVSPVPVAAYQVSGEYAMLGASARDTDEGADIIMVKPAMSYLDVVRAAADVSPVPVAAYQVSGEYAMISAAAANGWIDLQTLALETLTSIRRAGADIVLTYWAANVARWRA